MPGPAVQPRTAAGVRAALPITALCGCAGTALLALASPRLVAGAATRWWYEGPVEAHSLATALCYLGIALVVLAWLGLGLAIVHSEVIGVRAVCSVALAWSVPLLVGPPLFSHDLYSYLAQGTLYRLGVNPYLHAPSALAGLGRARVLDAVDPFWRHTTAPYGPSFIALSGLVALVFGSHLVGAICALRGLEVLGLALVADGVTRLARARGSDTRLACWLVLASPLTLLELVAPGHNDALMIGLVAEAVAACLARRVELAIVLAALATTVKPAAAIALVLIAVVVLRSTSRRRALVATGAGVATLAVVSAATGLGTTWVSGSVLAAPGKVLLSITPSSALAEVVHLCDRSVDARHLSTTISHLALGGAAVVIVVSCIRLREANLAVVLGGAFVLVTLAGPAAWPWYFAWGLALLATGRGVQRSRLVVAAVALSAFVMKPSGTLALPITTAPETLAVYALVGAGVVARRTRTHPARAT